MQTLLDGEDGDRFGMPGKIISDDLKKSFKNLNKSIHGLIQKSECQHKKRDETFEQLQHFKRLLDKVKEENADLRCKNAHLQARVLMTQPHDVILENQKRTEELFVDVYDALLEKLQKAETELHELTIRWRSRVEEQQLLKEFIHKEEQVRLLKEHKNIMTKMISVLEKTIAKLQTDSPTTDGSDKESTSLGELLEEQAKLQVEYELSNERLEQTSYDSFITGTMENTLENMDPQLRTSEDQCTLPQTQLQKAWNTLISYQKQNR
ncbi:hypothetical protein DPMN_164018 [Dreissena polymorpha]|uniref:Uncharacterized protein n=1 Tax=Dreissena polymorpha TaxID=45954 RepID=A0A9D4ETC0_DREPO|nr:hypothetical protein DPMN_164018 [Dreissena polymorpha]